MVLKSNYQVERIMSVLIIIPRDNYANGRSLKLNYILIKLGAII